MPEKDFEKQVQEKMEELRLRPGDPVWDKIERTLRKEKRRRVFFILPLLAGLLLLGYMGFRWMIHTKEQRNVATIDQTSI
jgi:type VI protein secretion system component VasF